jgi:hypothetical protein
MAGTDAQWTELDSRNERLADTADLPSAAPPSWQPGRPVAAAPRGRHHRRTGIAAAATVMAMAGAGAATAVPADAAVTHAQIAAGAWHIVKRVHSGVFGGFTAVTAAGKTGGWAFNGISKPTAWKRSGSSWAKVSFPGKSGESVVAAAASSATNVWAFTTGTKSRALRWNGSNWRVKRSFSAEIGGTAVLSRNDVWVFGEPFAPGADLGSWHYNGHSWSHVASGHGLEAGSGLSAHSVWAFGGTKVAHWNGHTWSRTSVKNLLPATAPDGLNDPSVTGIYAQSRHSVWAIGNGNREDEGGPLVVLHYNGHSWSRVARTSIGGSQFGPQVAPDGHGGLWIPVGPSAGGTRAHLLHYSGGHLTTATLPVAGNKIDINAVAAIPHTAQALAAGFTHSSTSLGSKVVSVILQFKG